MPSDDTEQYLGWLNPIQRDDYRAVVLEGRPQAARAKERGVTPATISTNVNNAKQRLGEIAEEQSRDIEKDRSDNSSATVSNSDRGNR